MPLRPPSIRPSLLTAAVCSLLFAGTMLLFDRSTGYDFLNYDDPSYLLNNEHVRAGLTWESIVWAFTGHADYWHPLTWISHMLDWEIHGRIAYGHHLTSIVWHAVNAVLVFLVLRRLTGSFWASAFTAACFAWHPLRVESVVWITERKDVMSGCFFLLTLGSYAAYASRRTTGRPATGFYLLTVAMFVLGLMSKPMVVSLPLVLLLLDFWPLRRAPLGPWRPWLGLLVEKLPFVALSAVASVVTVLMQTSHGAFTLELSLAARLANAAVSVVRYLGKFLWPAELAVFYPHPGTWPVWIVAGAVVLLGGLALLAWRQRRARPWLLVGWLWFLAVLLPVLGLLQVGKQAMADRYTYLSILGVQLALVWSAREWITRPSSRWIAGAAAAFVLLGCVVRTWQQQATWSDSVTLFRHAAAVSENNDVAHGFLAYTLANLGRLDEAEREAARAVALNPRNDVALFSLATIRLAQNRAADAAAFFQRALALKPKDAATRFQLGLTLTRLGRHDEAFAQLAAALADDHRLREPAIRHGFMEARFGSAEHAVTSFRAALAAGEADADAHFGLSLAFSRLGRADEAFAQLRRTIEIKPDFAPAHVELGLALLSRREAAEAATHFRAALASAPDFPTAHLGLGRALEQLGQFAAAVPSLERAVTLAPRDPAAQRAWAASLARRGRFADAVRHYELALAELPNDAALHAELGFALLLSQRRAEALARFEHALRLDPDFPGLRERLQRLRR